MYLYTSGINLRTQQFTYYILEGMLHHTILLDYVPPVNLLLQHCSLHATPMVLILGITSWQLFQIQ